MFRPCSARTRRTASSVPGSLRTATTIVVRRCAGGSTSGGVVPTRRRQDQEAGPVVRQVADLVGQHLEAEQSRGTWREDGGRPPFAAVSDGLAGARRVVGREELPRTGPQERLGLAEGLDVRVHALDVLEPLARERGEAQPHGDDDLAGDGQVVLDEQVVVLADRAVDDVLDRHDTCGGIAGCDRIEDRPEAA